MTINFKVSGNPLPKQSFKMGKRGGYTEPRIKAWQTKVAEEAGIAMFGKDMLRGKLEVNIFFIRGDMRRVDLDNLSKAVLDAMNKIVYEDDKQVTALHLYKGYNKDNPGIQVIVNQDNYKPLEEHIK